MMLIDINQWGFFPTRLVEVKVKSRVKGKRVLCQREREDRSVMTDLTLSELFFIVVDL